MCLGLSEFSRAASFVLCPTVLPCPAQPSQPGKLAEEPEHPEPSLSEGAWDSRECREAQARGEEQGSWISSRLNLGLCVSLSFKQRHFPYSPKGAVSLGNPGCRPSCCEWAVLSSIRCKSRNGPSCLSNSVAFPLSAPRHSSHKIMLTPGNQSIPGEGIATSVTYPQECYE